MSEERKALSKEPLNVLINPEAIRRQKPWQIDLVQLLNLFLSLLRRFETPDLRLCGSAALSSALIYRLKVETLFLFEKLKEEKRPIIISDPPGILSMPLRYELHSTSIEDLISTLQAIIDEIIAQAEPKPKPSVLEAEPEPEIDQFLLHLKERLEPFRRQIRRLLEEYGGFLFSEYAAGMSVIEQARAFIMVLFLAMERAVRLEQVGEDDIKVSVLDGPCP